MHFLVIALATSSTVRVGVEVFSVVVVEFVVVLSMEVTVSVDEDEIVDGGDAFNVYRSSVSFAY